MATTTSVERSSFVADFELIAGGQSFRPAELAPNFITLEKAEVVPPGPAELIVRIEGKADTRQNIQIVGPVNGHPLRLEILR